MKYSLKIAVFCIFSIGFATIATAGGTMVCQYPSTCKTITSSEYSTGGGDKIVQYMEMDCIDNAGNYIKYIDRIGSVGGMFGLGRITSPDKVIFKKWNKDELVCKK